MNRIFEWFSTQFVRQRPQPVKCEYVVSEYYVEKSDQSTHAPPLVRNRTHNPPDARNVTRNTGRTFACAV